MRVVAFDFDSSLLERFLGWPQEHYASDPNWLADPGEARQLSSASDAGAIWRNFLALEGDAIQGRLTALINPQLCDEAGHPFGQLGFFECVNDVSVASVLADAALDWLRANAPQAQTALALMNFDTWHAYRLRTHGFDQPTFLMEPYNPAYYPGLLEAAGFTPHVRYVTKTVSDLSSLSKAWAPYHAEALSQGYGFRSFNPASDADLSLVYHLSLDIFRRNLFFVEISEAEFRALYAGLVSRVAPDLLFFALDPAGEPVGFSFAAPHPRQPGAVNLKTFGILPRVRNTGLGAALACEAYRRFQAKGFTRVNHCLMRAGNAADQFDRGSADVTREYALYQRAL
jgi:GNAT superfamily N-acetyltransferase